jgi:endoglycosylceramidase
MRRILVVLLLALVAPAAAQAAPALPLDHAGRWTTDADGRVVILHGVNMVYKRPPYAPDAIGFDDADAAFLQSEGYNTVRVGVIYKAVEPQPGAYDDAYLGRIRDTVDMLARHGIVSLLDFHQDLYNERFQGEGWPDWAVIDDGLPAEPKQGFPNNYLVMPALQRAFDHFWNNDEGLQDRYAAAWRHVAERFRDVPAVLGYDLLNEPWPGSAWQQCANPAGCPAFDAMLTEFDKRAIAAIRAADPTTLAFYEPNVIFNDGAKTNLGDTGDAHAALSFHDYCLTADSGGPSSGCDNLDDMVFANAEEHVKQTGDTLLLTEFGATTDRAVLGGMADRADRFMVGWQEWHYCGCDDPTTSGPGDKQALVIDPRKPPAGDNLDAGKLKLLTRPYPQVVAGTPASYGFDASTRTFKLAYATRRADRKGSFGAGHETEIAVPARQYDRGYAVAVQGGTVRSAAGAAALRVAACPGAERVAVTVTPSGTSSATCAVPAARGATALRLRVSAAPALVPAGRRATVRVTVRAGSPARAVRGAVVRLAGARAVTDRQGRARLRKRFMRVGRRSAKATARGFTSGRATVQVRGSAPARAAANNVVVAETVWKFDASSYAIARGQPLTFDNQDQASPGPHNVTATANGPDGKPLFASKTIPKDQQAPVEGAQALAPGEYDFICTVHPFMQATLKVTGDAAAAPPAAGGSADTTPPKLRAALRTGSLRGALATGHVVASITSDELATLRLQVRARVGRRGVEIARARTTDGAPGRKLRVAAALTASGRRLLRRAHRLVVFLDVTATDAAGHTTRVRARRTLTR